MLMQILTSKLTGIIGTVASIGLLIALVVARIEIHSLNGKLDERDDRIAALRLNVATSQANEAKLQGSLDQCSASVQHSADVANSVAKAGAAAVAQVQAAGRSVDNKVAAIAAAPKNTCEDAFKILKTH